MALAGWGIIAFGLAGILVSPGQTNPAGLFRLLIGLNVVNDAIVIPAALAVALAARRLAPLWLRLPLQAGAVITALVVVYAFPFVSGAGRSARAGYSRLPLNYAHGLWEVLGFVWGACAVFALWSWRAHRRPLQ